MTAAPQRPVEPLAPMKRLGDALREGNDPTPEQIATRDHVLEIALAWQAGDLGMDGVRDLCSGFERWQAVRFADPSHEGYAALLRMIDLMVAGDSGILHTNHGIVVSEELHQGHVLATTNADGKRVWVWPMCFIHGEPLYPPVHLPHGEERRRIEEAIMARYEAYRDEKKKARQGRQE
jgi:hypothetical protein